MRCNRLIGALAANTNVQIKLYNPINLMTPWKINYRLHDKYLIVDGKQYLLGGRNTNDLFLGEYKDKEDRNIDREVLVCSDGTNSSTEALTAYFAKIWDLPCNKEISGNRRNLQKAQETLRTHYTELQGSYAELICRWIWKERRWKPKVSHFSPTQPRRKTKHLYSGSN